MRKYKPAEASKRLGISPATVYRLIKRHSDSLGESIEKDAEGKTLLTDEAIELLAKITGQEQRDANENQESLLEALRETIETQKRIIENHVENMQKKDGLIGELINKHDERMNQILGNQADERHRTDSIIMNMSNQVKSQMMLLEDMRKDIDQVKQMKVEKVEKRAKPVAKEAPIPVQMKTEKKTSQAKKTFGALYKLFLETFQPWKLREDVQEEKDAA